MTTCARCGVALPEGARFCPACGTSVEETAPAAEERKLATVLFADLVGSTELGASQDPERTRALLDRFYNAMSAEVEGAGGTVEKYAGDAVMAAFGVPVAHEDHAERALHCALSMQRRLHELFADELALRIGVNTGEVIAGRPREGSSFVTGDAVNVAARLEQAAAPSEILVGERTVAAARGAFEFADPATVEAKGKPEGVECRRLVRGLSLMRPRGVGGLRRAFVGRESELELLQATFRRVVSERRPHLVTVMGDAGVGKTRLLRELWEWLAEQEPEPLRRTGRCLPYGDGITYWPLGEILKEHLGLLETDPPETVLERLEPRTILGLTLGLDVAGDLHPLTARERLHEVWAEFLGELSSSQCLVVLVEDVHWAEEELLDLLDRLVRDVDGPLLLLGTARPELLDRRAAWGAGRRNASLVWLEPLSADDTERMVSELLSAELPAPVREVVERAEGNPFFVEELVSTLIDRDVLARQGGGWAVRELPEDFAVPDSVQAVVASRIDLLTAVDKLALQAASVIGRVFWVGPVRELLEGAEPDLDLLEDRDFIRHRAGSSMAGEREYAIKHALTREVAYGSIPRSRRARMHAGFARWLERVGEGRDEYASLLAHHYAEAVRPEDADLAWAGAEQELERLRAEAVEWLARAGELAIARYELGEGIALLERATELEPDARRRADLWREIGRANALNFDGPAFWTAMERSLEMSADRETRGDTYSLLAFHTSTRSGMWKRRPDPQVVDGWVEQALELTPPDSAARVRALIARANWRPEYGEESAREASAIADRLGLPELRSWAWEARAVAAFHDGRYDDAFRWARRRFDLHEEISDPDHLAEMRESAIPTSNAFGRFGEARRLAGEHDDLARGLSTHHRMHSVALAVEIAEAAGDWDDIRGLEKRVEQAVAANTDTPCVRNQRSLLVCATARVHAGDERRARELERVAEEIAMEGYPAALAGPRLRLALARRDLDHVEHLVADPQERQNFNFGIAAIAAWLDALGALRDRGTAEERAPAFVQPRFYLEPFALRALGIVRDDRELIARAQERFAALKLDWHASQTETLRNFRT